MSATADDTGEHASPSRWHWPGGGPNQRLTQAIGQLGAVLRASEPDTEANRLAKRNALISLRNARRALDQRWAHNEQAWAWFHAARREEFRLRTPADQKLLEIDLEREAAAKLKSSWRLEAVNNYESGDADRLVERLIAVQRHLDEKAENDNRKRFLQRRQVVIYLGILAAVLVLICILEFLDRGLLLAEGTVDGWWVVGAALYGTLGGRSRPRSVWPPPDLGSAIRSSAGPSSRTPSGRWRAGPRPSSRLPPSRPTCSAGRRPRAGRVSPSSASWPASASASSPRSRPSRSSSQRDLNPSTNSARRR
jgi:hypothetical protein